MISKLIFFKILLVFVLLKGFTNETMGQLDSAQVVAEKYTRYVEKIPIEKIYAHIDRSFYMQGETVWFKLNTVDANNKSCAFSKVAYVELLDENLKRVQTTKITLNKGMGSGSLLISATVPTGDLLFRVYTNYMKNFPTQYYFTQKISFVNPSVSIPIKTEPIKDNYNVSFFPEGGNLVANLSSVVGFKITDKYGNGVNCQGTVLNENNDTVVKFKSLKFGMGKFNLMPTTNSRLRGVIKLPNNKFLESSLPTILPTGYTMNLSESGKYLLIEVNHSDSTSLHDMYLIVHANQNKLVTETSTLSDKKCLFIIDKTRMKGGISCLTVFDNYKKPVCERLFFIRPKDTVHVDFLDLDSNYYSREKVNLTLSLAQLEKYKNEKISLSASVFLVDSLQDIPGNNVTNYLWLTSELRGQVENPEYYFENGAEVKAATENLLLTQGWRRFNWNAIMAEEQIKLNNLPEFEKATIQGKIKNRITGLPAKGIDAFVTIPNSGNFFYSSTSDENGNVSFPLRTVYGSNEVIFQINEDQNKDFIIEIKSDYIDSAFSNYTSNAKKIVIAKDNLQTRLVNANVTKAYYSEEMKNIVSPVSSYIPFYGNSDKTYFLDKYTRFPTMEEVLREYIPEVLLRKKKSNFECLIYNKKTSAPFENQPLILLDGLPIFNTNNIVNYDPRKVEKIEIIQRKYFLGNQIYSGVVQFFTYRRNLTDFKISESALVYDYEGLQNFREFYTPANTSTLKPHFPDFRNLLYWNSNIDIESGQQSEIDFITSMQSGKYALVINGISSEGRTCYGVKTFEVKKMKVN